MAIPTALHIVAPLLVVTLLTIANGMKEEEEKERILTVSGRGSVSAAPDLATIETGVITEAKTARKALTLNNAVFARIRILLEEQNIDDRDIQTLNFDVREQFARLKRGGRGNFTGYRVENDLEIKVRDFDSLGVILDSLVTAGSNSIDGIDFSIEDPTPLIDEARREAVSDAQSSAALYAKFSGVKLGRLITISEQSSLQPRFFTAAAAFRGAKGGNSGEGGVSTAGGEVDTTIRVSAEYEFSN